MICVVREVNCSVTSELPLLKDALPMELLAAAACTAAPPWMTRPVARVSHFAMRFPRCSAAANLPTYFRPSLLSALSSFSKTKIASTSARRQIVKAPAPTRSFQA